MSTYVAAWWLISPTFYFVLLPQRAGVCRNCYVVSSAFHYHLCNRKIFLTIIFFLLEAASLCSFVVLEISMIAILVFVMTQVPCCCNRQLI